MSNDDRDTLELLYEELDFVEKGGYGRSVRTPWKPTSVFKDSLSCLNYGYPDKVHPCSDCLLIDSVPDEKRAEFIPCHHILLNKDGDTIETLEAKENQPELEEKFKSWLRTEIQRIEEERLQQKPAEAVASASPASDTDVES